MIIDNLSLLNEFKGLLNNVWIQVFVWTVILDILSGTIKGVFFKREGNSTKGLAGVIKHLLVVLLVTVAYPYLKIINMESVGVTFVIFYIASYGISIIENLGQMGVPVPEFIKNKLTKIKDDSNNGEVSGDNTNQEGE